MADAPRFFGQPILPGPDGKYQCPPKARDLNLIHRHVAAFHQAHAAYRSCYRVWNGRRAVLYRRRALCAIDRERKALTGMFLALTRLVGFFEADRFLARLTSDHEASQGALDELDGLVGMFWVDTPDG
jgi:hypothetical protein